MSQEERIEELERLVAELQAAKENHNKGIRPWTEVSRYIECNLEDLEGVQENPKMKWNIKESIITLIRHKLGLRRIQNLHNDQVEKAKSIADRLLDVYKSAVA